MLHVLETLNINVSFLATSPPVGFARHPALPSVNNDGVIIQKGKNFYEFSCDANECIWTTKPQQLIQGRDTDAIAMYLPPDFPGCTDVGSTTEGTETT